MIGFLFTLHISQLVEFVVKRFEGLIDIPNDSVAQMVQCAVNSGAIHRRFRGGGGRLVGKQDHGTDQQRVTDALQNMVRRKLAARLHVPNVPGRKIAPCC